MTPADALEQAEKEILLTVKEYSALFGVTPRGVHKAIKADRLPYPVERPCGMVAKIRVPAALVAKLNAA